ncbi:MAG: LysR family transcriptional regulator [Burkholderiales bacterium]|nr:LysR family transcriptional regulator [Burkholderiales bacterium]
MFDDIIVFIHLYETKSFTKTAELLKIRQPTVSRRINKLEDNLNDLLIQRNGSEFTITTFGEYMYSKFRNFPMFLNKTLNDYKKDQHENSTETIKVSLASALSYELLAPNIESFIKRYPNITLNIYYESQMPDFQVVDFAITRHNVKLPGFVTNLFRQEIAHLYCSNKYAQKHGIPNNINDLDEISIIKLVLDNKLQSHIIHNYKTGQQAIPKWKGNIYLNHVLYMKQIGINSEDYIFACWDILCTKEIANGELIKILPNWQIHTLDFYLITKLHLRAVDKLFIDFISKQLDYHL